MLSPWHVLQIWHVWFSSTLFQPASSRHRLSERILFRWLEGLESFSRNFGTLPQTKVCDNFKNFSSQCFNLVPFHCCQKRSRFHSFVRGLCLGSRRCQSDIFLFNNRTLRRNKVLAGLVLIIRLLTFFNEKKSEFDQLDITCKIVHGCFYDCLSKYEVKRINCFDDLDSSSSSWNVWICYTRSWESAHNKPQ